VPISALYGTNIEQLEREILNKFKDYVRASFTIPVTKETMSFMAWLFKSAHVEAADYAADSVHVVFEASPSFAEKVRNRVAKEFNGKMQKV
jgi:50S ribosomal subunit-associated GTPase HflX